MKKILVKNIRSEIILIKHNSFICHSFDFLRTGIFEIAGYYFSAFIVLKSTHLTQPLQMCHLLKYHIMIFVLLIC